MRFEHTRFHCLECDEVKRGIIIIPGEGDDSLQICYDCAGKMKVLLETELVQGRINS